jgi:2-methylisoborneol synthase
MRSRTAFTRSSSGEELQVAMSLLNRVSAPPARHEAAALAAALLAAPPSAPASLHPAKQPVLGGPRGLGTSSLRPVPPRAGRPAVSHPGTGDTQTNQATRSGAARNGAVPELYSPPALRDHPALGELVNERLIAWAGEIGLYPDSLDHVRHANFGCFIMLAHPESEDPDRLLAAAKCALAEWATDDAYCDDESEGARPDLLGARLGLAYTAIDPPMIGAQRQPALDAALREDPVRVALDSALGHLAQYATPGQVDRLRLELLSLFNGYNTEGSWRRTEFIPPVWQYLAERQQNSFMPTIAVIDVVGGYHLSATEYGAPPVRRAVLMAALAATLVNDLYSMSKEQGGTHYDYNLPTLIAAEERCSLGEAVRRAAALHDELVRTYEREAAALAAAGSPALARFLAGTWAWLGGNHEWHRTTAHYATGLMAR